MGLRWSVAGYALVKRLNARASERRSATRACWRGSRWSRHEANRIASPDALETTRAIRGSSRSAATASRASAIPGRINPIGSWPAPRDGWPACSRASPNTRRAPRRAPPPAPGGNREGGTPPAGNPQPRPRAPPGAAAPPPQAEHPFLPVHEVDGGEGDRVEGYRKQGNLDPGGKDLLSLQPGQKSLNRRIEAGDERCV